MPKSFTARINPTLHKSKKNILFKLTSIFQPILFRFRFRNQTVLAVPPHANAIYPSSGDRPRPILLLPMRRRQQQQQQLCSLQDNPGKTEKKRIPFLSSVVFVPRKNARKEIKERRGGGGQRKPTQVVRTIVRHRR